MASRFDPVLLRRERERQQMPRVELARRSGRSFGLLAKVETGVMTPSVGSLVAFADALGVSPGDFFTTDDHLVGV